MFLTYDHMAMIINDKHMVICLNKLGNRNENMYKLMMR